MKVSSISQMIALDKQAIEDLLDVLIRVKVGELEQPNAVIQVAR